MGRLGVGCRWLLPRLKYGNRVRVSLLLGSTADGLLPPIVRDIEGGEPH